MGFSLSLPGFHLGINNHHHHHGRHCCGRHHGFGHPFFGGPHGPLPFGGPHHCGGSGFALRMPGFGLFMS